MPKNQFEQPLNYQDWIDDQTLDEAWRKYDKQYHPVQEALSQMEELPQVQPVRAEEQGGASPGAGAV